MKTVSLSGSLRENVGKKDTKALRNAEMVPCVMYGAGEEQIHFATAEKNFTKILYTLDGRRVTSSQMKKGVYIVGGKKIIK